MKGRSMFPNHHKKGFEKFITVLSLLLVIFLGPVQTVYAIEIVISGNGSESVNEVTTQVTTQTEVLQTNEASVQNTVNIDANTGSNSSSENTGGDTSIQTGDIKVNTEIATSANSSSVETPCCDTNPKTDIIISGNGDNTQNSVNVTKVQETTIYVNQDAKINNVVNGQANTGGNQVFDNGGSVRIETGDIYVNGKTKNGSVNVYHF